MADYNDHAHPPQHIAAKFVNNMAAKTSRLYPPPHFEQLSWNDSTATTTYVRGNVIFVTCLSYSRPHKVRHSTIQEITTLQRKHSQPPSSVNKPICIVTFHLAEMHFSKLSDWKTSKMTRTRSVQICWHKSGIICENCRNKQIPIGFVWSISSADWYRFWPCEPARVNKIFLRHSLTQRAPAI